MSHEKRPGTPLRNLITTTLAENHLVLSIQQARAVKIHLIMAPIYTVHCHADSAQDKQDNILIDVSYFFVREVIKTLMHH